MREGGPGLWYVATSAATLACVTFACLMCPICLIPRSGNGAPHAMTTGCATASCCTSRCYLDGNGVHHCVPQSGASCECGLSAGDDSPDSAPSLQTAAFPPLDSCLPADPGIETVIFSPPGAPSRVTPATTPPPRA